MRKPTPGTDNRVLRVCRLLNRHRARYLLVGGVAANLHGSVRATRDVDILVPRDEPNMSRVLAALGELPYGVAGELESSEMVQKAITIVGDDPRVDVLTIAWSVTFEKAWPGRVVRRIQGIRVSYLGRPDLIASKQTGRPSDQADIEQLAATRTTAVRRRRA
ncbi:MAG: hypothetical protein NTV05_07290 [Acidobacteria bacterium]|nr:hypothetical protein [Acidobacteriota bacterium]